MWCFRSESSIEVLKGEIREPLDKLVVCVQPAFMALCLCFRHEAEQVGLSWFGVWSVGRLVCQMKEREK